MDICFIVITAVPNPLGNDENSGGNLYDTWVIPYKYRDLCDDEIEDTYLIDPPKTDQLIEAIRNKTVIDAKVEVFQVGEVLICDSVGEREIPYPGRKPSKWTVSYERYDDIQEALKRSVDVFNQSLK